MQEVAGLGMHARQQHTQRQIRAGLIVDGRIHLAVACEVFGDAIQRGEHPHRRGPLGQLAQQRGVIVDELAGARLVGEAWAATVRGRHLDQIKRNRGASGGMSGEGARTGGRDGVDHCMKVPTGHIGAVRHAAMIPC